jgi:hypothetical protein
MLPFISEVVLFDVVAISGHFETPHSICCYFAYALLYASFTPYYAFVLVASLDSLR